MILNLFIIDAWLKVKDEGFQLLISQDSRQCQKPFCHLNAKMKTSVKKC